MPLYPFTCNECEAEFEALVARATAEPTAECPSCGSTQVTRGFGVPAKIGTTDLPRSNCRGDGPPCGAPQCGRRPLG